MIWNDCCMYDYKGMDNNDTEYDVIDQEWDDYLENDSDMDMNECLKECEDVEDKNTPEYDALSMLPETDCIIPVSSPLIISTKSKEIEMKIPVNLDIFWNIELIPYDSFRTGILKKQRRIKCMTPDEYDVYNADKVRGISVQGCNYMQELVTKHMDVQKVKKRHFNHVSMISFGICSKDILKKRKQAFMNCFVLIIRLQESDWNTAATASKPNTASTPNTPNTNVDSFHEYHVKVFNTGKVAFTGVKNELILAKLFSIVVTLLKQYQPSQFDECSMNIFDYPEKKILVNSNFKCGFCIHQPKLRQLYTTKYNTPCIFNAGNQYTGLRCKYYYDTNKSLEEQTGLYVHTSTDADANTLLKATNDDESKQPKKKNGAKNRTDKILKYPSNIVRVSYAIFRTGSVLIAGKCSDEILNVVYHHIIKVLHTEFRFIYTGIPDVKIKKTPKNKKHIKVLN